nr:hypothetical protein [Nocardia wallacei]
MQDVVDHLVESDQMQGSATRADLFGGLAAYLEAWDDLDVFLKTPHRLLKTIWIAGSFATSTLDPNDIDVSPIVDGELASTYAGKPGSGRLRDLIGDRRKLRSKYGLDVFPIRWRPVVHVLTPGTWDNDDAAYLSDRGKFDDFWQRCRVDGSDVPSRESCTSRRGYLEVRL